MMPLRHHRDSATALMMRSGVDVERWQKRGGCGPVPVSTRSWYQKPETGQAGLSSRGRCPGPTLAIGWSNPTADRGLDVARGETTQEASKCETIAKQMKPSTGRGR